MSDHSPSSHFRGLFEAALQDYEKQTGTALVNHPFAERLQECDSVDAINPVLQERTQRFTDFRGDGKIMKALKSTVSILYALSTNTAFTKIMFRFEMGGQAKVIDYLTGALPNLFTAADASALEQKLEPAGVRESL